MNPPDDSGANDGRGDAWALKQTGYFRWTQIYEGFQQGAYPFWFNKIKAPTVIGGGWRANGTPIDPEGYLLNPIDYAFTNQITGSAGAITWRIGFENIVTPPLRPLPGYLENSMLLGVGGENGTFGATGSTNLPNEITGAGVHLGFFLYRGNFFTPWPGGGRWTIRITWKVSAIGGSPPDWTP